MPASAATYSCILHPDLSPATQGHPGVRQTHRAAAGAVAASPGEVTPAEVAEAAEAAPGKGSYNALKALYNERAYSFVQANYGGDIFKTVFPRYHFQGSQ